MPNQIMLGLIKLLPVVTICLCAGTSASAADTFRNLGFETARNTLPPRLPGQIDHNVPIELALPGWRAFIGTNSLQTVVLNDITAGSANVEILDRQSDYAHLVIDGDFSVLLQSGSDGRGQTSASISQFGMVPAEAESLQFKALAEPFLVSFAGQELPLFTLSKGTDSTLFGANMMAFAGQAGDLKFTAFMNPISLDSIVFSPQQVPEPSYMGFLSLGALILVRGFWRRGSSALADSPNGAYPQVSKQ